MSAVTGSAESHEILEIKQEYMSDDSSDGERRLVIHIDKEVIESKEELKESFTKLKNDQSDGQSPTKSMKIGAKLHQCTECQAKFILEQDLKNHVTCHASPSQHTCVICRENFKDSSSLNIHVLALHKLMHRCHICMEGFSHKGPYLVHMRIHRSGKSQQRINSQKTASEFKCEICQKTVAKQEVEKHRKKHLLEQVDKSYHNNIALQKDTEIFEYLHNSKRKRKIGEVEQGNCILHNNFFDKSPIKTEPMENVISTASDVGQSHDLNYKKDEEHGEIIQPFSHVESVLGNIKMEPNVLDNSKMKPNMNNIEMEQNLLDNSKMEPNMSDNIEMEPNLLDNIKIEPHVSDNIEMEPNMSDNLEMESKKLDNIKIEPRVSDNIEMEPNMSDNLEMEQNILDNIKLEPHLSDNIEIEPNILDNIKIEPHVSDNIEMEPIMSDNIETEPNLLDNIKIEPNVSNDIEMEPNISDNLETEPNILDNIKIEPHVSDNIEIESNMSDNLEMKRNVLDNIKMEPDTGDQCVDVTKASQNNPELSAVFLMGRENHLDTSPLVIPKTEEKLDNEMEAKTLQDSLIPKQNEGETSDTFRNQASEFMKRKVTKFELEDLRKYKYLCEDCGQSFSRISNLNLHKHSHVSGKMCRTSEPDNDKINGSEKTVYMSYNIGIEPNMLDNTRMESNVLDNITIEPDPGDQCVDVTETSQNNPELSSVFLMGREDHLDTSPLVIPKPEEKLDNEMEAKTLQDSLIPKQNKDETSDNFRNQASEFMKRKVTNRDCVSSGEKFELDDLHKYKYLCDKCGQTFSRVNYLNLHMRSHVSRKTCGTLESDDVKIHASGISDYSNDNQEIINTFLQEKNPQAGVQSYSITSSDNFHINDSASVSDITEVVINQNTCEQKCSDEYEQKDITSIASLCTDTSRPSSLVLYSPNTSAQTRPTITAPSGSDTSCQTKSTVDSINLNSNKDSCLEGNFVYDGQCLKGETKDSIMPSITSSRTYAEQNIREVEGKIMFDCPSCHAKLDSEEMFKSHMKLHDNEIRYYRFRCDVCNISFGRSTTLIRHRKLHCYKHLQTRPY